MGMPFIDVGCGGSGIVFSEAVVVACGGRLVADDVGANCVELDDVVRDAGTSSTPFAVLLASCCCAIACCWCNCSNADAAAVDFGMPVSNSGNVMKNKQPNVVPKKAPSTV